MRAIHGFSLPRCGGSVCHAGQCGPVEHLRSIRPTRIDHAHRAVFARISQKPVDVFEGPDKVWRNFIPAPDAGGKHFRHFLPRERGHKTAVVRLDMIVPRHRNHVLRQLPKQLGVPDKDSGAAVYIGPEHRALAKLPHQRGDVLQLLDVQLPRLHAPGGFAARFL